MSSMRIQLGASDPSTDVYHKFYSSGWTDGMPIIPPTPARVENMIAQVGRDPAEVVAVMPPRQGEATVELLAINAVMSGCLPEYFPVVVAAVEAITDRRFPLASFAGLKPETPFLLVNGPVRDYLDINSGRGCLGPGWRANATIGRAIRLIMINVGGLSPGGHARTSFSSPLQFTFCAAEDELGSPWPPFHVEAGMPSSVSTVSAFRVDGYVPILASLDWDQSPDGLIQHTALSMVSLGNTAMYAGNLSALVLFNSERARILADAGLGKSEVKRALWEASKIPAAYFPESEQRALDQKGRIAAGLVSLVDGPEDIRVAVLGGSGVHTVFLPGFSHEASPTAPVTKQVRG